MSCVRAPCPSCPWRVDQTAAAIPNFRLDLAEDLAATCPRGGYGPAVGTPMFGCHLSRPGEEVVCAGWLARAGSAHPGARIGVIAGLFPAEALDVVEGWPDLHETYDDVLDKLRDGP